MLALPKENVSLWANQLSAIKTIQEWERWLLRIRIMETKSRDLLPLWRCIFVDQIGHLEHNVRIYHNESQFLETMRFLLKGSRGFLNGKNKFNSKNTGRPFTSLSESVILSLRSLWTVSRKNSNKYIWLEIMVLLAEFNPLSAFLSQEEITDFLETFCWNLLETQPTHAFVLASFAAKHLENVHDRALALKYISWKVGYGHYSAHVWTFFRLLDPDDQEAFELALSFLPRQDFRVLKSINRIIEITKLNDELAKLMFIEFLEPLLGLDLIPDHILGFIDCIRSFVLKIDIGASHVKLLRALSNAIKLEPNGVLDLLGIMIDQNYKFHLEPSLAVQACELILTSPDCPKKFWALANYASNTRWTCNSQIMAAAVLEIDNTENLPSVLRIIGSYARHEEEPERLFKLLARIQSEDQKVQWTLANAISRMSENLPIPSDIVEKLVALFEGTGSYKVAIACANALIRIFMRQGNGSIYHDRIQRAVLSQRFSITDVYNERYSQTLRRANSELLNKI